ncbi:helix-turn-helix domain-containing protein [Micromonospora sp. NPDC051141]|uniref:helix-turn-helix domain-containing protein n=1 Tax=Micromonospora sp. NPDC051141 TaxID=3364284 RepID=UPI0037A14AAA
MSKTKIDIAALHGALNAARESHGLSWRQLAKEIGVSPSMLFRLGNGDRPDADGFATLVTWLGMPAEEFMIGVNEAPKEQPELMTQLAPLLRARADLTNADVVYLEEVIRATLRRAHSAKQEHP